MLTPAQYAAAEAAADTLFHAIAADCTSDNEGGGRNIDTPTKPAELAQCAIASLVAKLIDAGSEREVVLEDEQLTVALNATFDGWRS